MRLRRKKGKHIAEPVSAELPFQFLSLTGKLAIDVLFGREHIHKRQARNGPGFSRRRVLLRRSLRQNGKRVAVVMEIANGFFDGSGVAAEPIAFINAPPQPSRHGADLRFLTLNYSRPRLRISMFKRLIFWFNVDSGMRNCSAASVWFQLQRSSFSM